ncbi:Siderophore synthetase component [Nitrosospira sp. Nsp18]|uniref:IucA/IucC family protein n=1 Tax=Nitrosospira sp. Nsp18 TaxID=1855334 RepID=UPI00088B9888|nr:IucA/IucC family protein [Nitrosospira sp. Nsp18]SDA21005.1 Siderophore synthetase component [Nitrosospira sp. Nsp18]
MQIIPPHPYANRLAQDLFDALWLENLYDFRGHCILHPEADGKAVMEIALDETRSLRWQGQKANGLRPFRVQGSNGVLHTNTNTATNLELSRIVEVLQTADWWSDGTGRFSRFFTLAYDQAAFAAVHEQNILESLMAAPEDLLPWEALSCLKDRPFHPLARAKDWNGDHGYGYATETMASLPLHWVAVPRDQIVSGPAAPLAGQPLAERLLDPGQRDRLTQAARASHADGENWLWMPVHPWQWAWLNRSIPLKLSECIYLSIGPGTATPTASLRSLAVTGNPGTHLKLALSVRTLGATRALPPRYLHNGTLASACLESLRRRDDWLAAHLLLCDEDQWWALSQCDALESESGELACMIRRYPTLPGATLIPMAALPAVWADGKLPAFDHLIGSAAPEEAAWRLFGDIAGALLELGLRCFARGVMPELHGQNVLLAFEGQQVAALVLRDHDTLRVCCPLMQAQGVTIPDYVIDRSTPNTLELNTPQELLAYLQTLAIEVNLYAILAALATYYGRDEAHGWGIVRQALETCLARVPLPVEIAGQARKMLLEEAEWPFKQLLAPLLNITSFGTGMPSAMGRLPNPLLTGSPSWPKMTDRHRDNRHE